MWSIDNFSFDNISIKDHAALRMISRNISKAELLELIQFGEMIEDYPTDYPFPSKLIFKIVQGRPLHAVIANNVGLNQGIVITLYEPDDNHFASDFKTRKT